MIGTIIAQADPILQIFFILWMFVLPILGIITPILSLVIWFFIVPKVARMLTGAKFRNVSIHAIADDSGYVELVKTNVELPEGVVKTKKGWRFLPRPIWKSLKTRRKKKTGETLALEGAENIALRKYVLKGLGKPFWFGYAGTVAAMNPPTLAVLQQNQNPSNPQGHFNKIENYIESLPKEFPWNNQTIYIRKDLKQMLAEVKEYLKSKTLTILDPRALKEILPELTPPSLMDAIEMYSEMVGREERGTQYGKIIGVGLIFGVIIFGIIAIMVLK